MRLRWRLIFPLIGLAVYGAETLHSLRVDREIHRTPSRYFWWSSIRLDSNPLNKPVPVVKGCEGVENCSSWDLPNMWVSPGVLAKFLMLSAFPAFIVCFLVLSGLRRFGINEFWSFMVCMPLLLFAWYYLVGWMVDRFRNRNQENT
jgi:hypothetical protein